MIPLSEVLSVPLDSGWGGAGEVSAGMLLSEIQAFTGTFSAWQTFGGYLPGTRFCGRLRWETPGPRCLTGT